MCALNVGGVEQIAHQRGIAVKLVFENLANERLDGMRGQSGACVYGLIEMKLNEEIYSQMFELGVLMEEIHAVGELVKELGALFDRPNGLNEEFLRRLDVM